MSSPGIVEALDVLEHGESGLVPVGKALPVKRFAFQPGEEALTQGVVVVITRPNPWRA